MATETTANTLRAGIVTAAVIALVGFGAAHVQADPVDLQVVNRDTGQVLPIWRHHGRLFVAGEPGARYSLRVTNNTGGRVEVVTSVDGVNVVSGQTAGFNQRGYVLYAGESYDVTGWRKSNDEVAAFTFAPLPDSYAARTGRPADVGVVGIAVFQEKAEFAPPAISVAPGSSSGTYDRRQYGYSNPPTLWKPGAAGAPPPPPPVAMLQAPPVMARAIPAPSSGVTQGGWSAYAKQSDERLGTAHGAREWSSVTLVDFVKATTYPAYTCEIEYDTYAHLVAEGVIRRPLAEARHPRPFPSAPPNSGYVPDPPDDP